MQIKYLWVGKTKNSSIRALIGDYLERIRHWVSCEVVETRDLSKSRTLRIADLIESEGEEILKHFPKFGRIVVLDETGKQYASSDFARWLESEQNSGTRSITFIIGGPEGLSQAVINRAHMVLSLGKMTWTHEMCRVLLLEQVYRALCIMRKIPYHKGDN
jgi:23S rRNA (pseudouridine1915-N3)-methyltransferase